MRRMNHEMNRQRPYFQWVALNTLVWPISNIVYAALLKTTGAIQPSVPVNVVGHFAIGFVIGTTQWLFLKKYYSLPFLWALTIAISYILYGMVHWVVGGVFAGASQYILLRKDFQRPIIWLVISLFAALFCFWAMQPSDLFLLHGTFYGIATLLAVGLRKRNNEGSVEILNSRGNSSLLN